MPMPCTLMIVGAALAIRCGRFLDGAPPPDPCFLEAALRGRSTTDVVFASRMAVEKGLDDKSRCAVAAADIERFYDGIDPVLTAECLSEEGMADSTSVPLARLHLCVSVFFEAGAKTIHFSRRAAAVLTGTRTSIIAGRTVVRDIGIACADRLKAKALEFGQFKCAALSFVDNFYTYSHSAFGALANMQIIEVELWHRWRLKFGPDSKCIIDCSKPWLDLDHSQHEYKPVSSILVLGCIVSSNGSSEQCYTDCRSKMWRAFYGTLAKHY